ncbi:MAG: hypothetical protein K2N22_01385 [Clostridia bacterium]|nr:hypothetical protein [Clostridia bacterium]
MQSFNGKVIKRAYIHRYRIIVEPDVLLDENGIERKPQNLRYFMVLDQNGFFYIIPAKYDNDTMWWVKCYEPEDIAEAASGNEDKIKLIEDIHEQVRQIFCNRSLFTEDWIRQAFSDTIEIFISQHTEKLAEKNMPPVPREEYSTSAKTIKNFPQEKLNIVFNNAVYPPEPKYSPFTGE